jgi:hypothetical protein
MKRLVEQSESVFAEALGFLKTLERSLQRKSKFNNELLYQITAMSIEKLLVSLLAYHGINATHHTPIALIREANTVKPLPESMIKTAELIGRYESICSISGFGYKIPADDELRQMILGLIEIKDYVGKCVHSPAV